MPRLPNLTALAAGLLLSRRGRGFVGRNAGKLALVGLALQWLAGRSGGRTAASVRRRPSRR